MRRSIYRAAMAVRLAASVLPSPVAMPDAVPVATAAHGPGYSTGEAQQGGIQWRGIYGRSYDRSGVLAVAIADYRK